MKDLTFRPNFGSLNQRTRVFQVEERDECLHLTKRFAPMVRRAYPIFGVALFFVVCGWRIYAESASAEPNLFSWMGPIVIGFAMMIIPMWEFWRA